MLEKYFVRPDTVDRIRASWLAPSIELYVAHLTENRYSQRSVTRRIPILVGFGTFAKDRGAQKVSDLPDHVEPFVQKWITDRVKKRASTAFRKKVGECTRSPIQQMLGLSLPDYIGKGRSRRPDNPFAEAAPDFFKYLVHEKGLRDASVRQYRHVLRGFANYLTKIKVTDIKHLAPAMLSGFVTDYSQRVGWASLRNACGALRVFLRYLHRQRILKKDFGPAIGQPRSYRLSGIPRSIDWGQIQRVLELVDRRTPTGRRDYAILLLLVTYGLRGREIAALTLDDIDWRSERLKVPERKAGHSTAYPLSPIVGEAILAYLKSGRPQTKQRQIFFRSQAPVVPFGAAAVSSRASHYLHKAGIKVPRLGSHTFRHSCVQRLVDANFTLKSIGDYVGHRSPSSTQIYAKVDIESLRQVAIGDGEEVL
jgi:integrase/recombinase XerD